MDPKINKGFRQIKISHKQVVRSWSFIVNNTLFPQNQFILFPPRQAPSEVTLAVHSRERCQ